MAKKHYLFAVNHPSQFHMFKNLARKLIDDGHHCVFFIQQRGIIEDLVKVGRENASGQSKRSNA